MKLNSLYKVFNSRIIVKASIWLIALVFSLLFALIIALHIPSVQTKVVKKITSYISDQIDHPIEIGYVNLIWYDKMYLNDVVIRDTQHEKLITVDQLIADFDLPTLFSPSQIHLDQVKLQGARVALKNNAVNEQVNISYFVKKLRQWLLIGKGNSKSKIFSIAQVDLIDSEFSLNTLNKDSIRDKRWDYSHFTLKDIQGKFSSFKVHKDTFAIQVNSLTCHDAETGLEVHNLSSYYRITAQNMVFNQMELEVGDSYIENDMIFKYDAISGLSYFEDSVEIEAKVKNSRIYSGDLALFAPLFNQYHDYYQIVGQFDGNVNRFTVEQFELGFGNQSNLSGYLSLDGLPEFQDTFIDLDLQKSLVRAKDLQIYLKDDEVYQKLKRAGYLRINGRFTGFPSDFVAQGRFYSDLGKIESDINLKLQPEDAETTYSGNLTLTEFDLGAVLGNEELVQKVSMQGKIQGKGVTPQSADFKLNAGFKKFEFKNYAYRNIYTDARFSRELFIGKLSIDDPNLKFQANALIDLRNGKDEVDITAQLDTANLAQLKLSPYNYFIQSFMDLNFTGLKLDSIEGEAHFANLTVQLDDRAFFIDSLDITSQKNDVERLIFASSDNFTFNAVGNFQVSVLLKDLMEQVNEYQLTVNNQEQEIQDYYSEKKRQEYQDYFVRYDVFLKDINPILNLYYPQSHISPGTRFDGVFTGGYTTLLSFNSEIDTLQLGNYSFYQTQVDLKTSKNFDGPEIDAHARINSMQQAIQNKVRTENLETVFNWKKKHIDFNVSLDQYNSTNYAAISGELDFLNNRTLVHFNPSEMQVLDQVWKFNVKNQISIAKKEIEFIDFELFYKNQNIYLNGKLSDSLDQKLLVNIEDFKLENLHPVTNQDFSGEINGFMTIRSFYDDPIMESNMDIHQFKINQFLIGNINIKTFWDNITKYLNIGVDVLKDQEKIIAMSGYIDPDDPEKQLHIYAYFNNAHLSIAEPFVGDLFSRINGVASGEFEISGMINSPILYGSGLIKNGQMTVNYLNTRYDFAGNIIFDENRIAVENLKVRDDENHLASLNGGFFHDGFSNFVIDLTGQMNNFKVMNTTARDNSLYYGVAYATGTVNFLGSPSNLNISANAVSEKGTKIYIPLSETSTIEQQEFIQFITLNDTLKYDNDGQEIEKVDLKGLNLDFDLEITPDAYCELIFDIKAGDIIRGRGNGKLKLQIDTEGDFNMFGDFEIQEGAYNFTLYNVINKEFQILPESRITWSGDPYRADLDIKATYNQLASLAPLFQDEVLQRQPDIIRKYPAKVMLDLEGDLFSPEINFDIGIEEYPNSIIVKNNVNGAEESYPYSLEAEVSAFKNRINTDEQELKRQVFSLMILRRFSPENSFQVSGSIGNSVSEFLSNQLSYWATQFDENLEIDVDLGSLDEEAFNTFQLRLSYTFLDGRLRITRAGGFTNRQNQADLSTIAGDWTVEYLLTPDGKLRVKMYNKTNYNSFGTINTSTTAGFSLMHTQSFDEVMEIFRNARDNSGDIPSEPAESQPAPENAMREENDEFYYSRTKDDK
ncbi:MAG: translocation/assembly module TamB domain-containing protein [Candidatus Cyclobacteriaceae bacterium M3_2C_046]